MSPRRGQDKSFETQLGFQPGFCQELKDLSFSIPVGELSRVDEDDNIVTRGNFFFVKTKDFPDLSFGAISLNCITEFLGQADTKSRPLQGIRRSGELRSLATGAQGRSESPLKVLLSFQPFLFSKASSHRKQSAFCGL